MKRIVISPAYDEQTSDADVALLELQHAVVEAPVATAADVSGWSGRTATAYGWGDLTNVGARPCALGQATLRVVDTRTCARELARDDAGPISLTSSMCAAPLRSGGEDVCHGDSGGPLVGDDDGHPALLGVVSWGEGCRTGRPGVFASATAVRDLLRIVDRE